MTAAHAATESAPNEAAAPLVWIDGRRVDPPLSGISPLDRGFTLADGVFETIRADHGVAFRLEAHLGRLARGATLLGMSVPAGVPDTIAEGLSVVRELRWAEAAIRLTVSRGVGPRGVSPPSNGRSTVVLTIHPLAPRDSRAPAGITVRTARARRNEFAATAGVKTLAYVEAVIAMAEAHGAGADDAIFLDTAGHVSEATSSNVFLVANAELRTPPLECGVLPGITRAAVLELANALGIAASEDVVTTPDLAGADEVFLTSSIRGLAPVRRIDGRPLPNGAPGPITRRLSEAFDQLVEGECRP